MSHFKEIPTLKVGQDIQGVGYVFDLKDNICGIFNFDSNIFYLNECYEYAEPLYHRLLLTQIKFECYVDRSRPRTLQELQDLSRA